jgi:YesN/AraC family two-component response regulator
MAIILTKKYSDLVLHTATNGRTGMELFRTYSPNIVITDITMP